VDGGGREVEGDLTVDSWLVLTVRPVVVGVVKNRSGRGGVAAPLSRRR
jgi:hypothetical protein